MIKAIRSGAQTGADIAGLDAGLALGLQVSGMVPKGRRIDGGTLTNEQMARYNLIESASSAYPPRTEYNVVHACATALFGNLSSPGCRLTLKYCQWYVRPYIINPTAEELRAFCERNEVHTLNVAGNRQRTNPGIYERVYAVIVAAFGSNSVA